MKGKLVDIASSGDFIFQLEDGTTKQVPKSDLKVVAAMEPRKIAEVDAAFFPRGRTARSYATGSTAGSLTSIVDGTAPSSTIRIS